MDNQALFEVLEALDGALSHIPYAVGGSAALAVWGRALPRPVHVTVFCPPYSKENIRFWAAVHGMFVYPDRPDTIGVRTSDGRTRSVRIKFVAGTTDRHGRQAVESLPVVDGKMARHSQNSQPHDSANDATDDGAGTLFAQRFKTVRIAHARRALVWSTGADAPVAMSTIPTTARVLTLSCLLNMLAYEYVRADQIAQRPKQGDSRGRTGGADTVSFEGRPGKAPASWALFKLASDILWVLHRILEGGFVDEGAMPLSWGEVPHVADARFWDVFTMRHEGADKLFEEAGLFRRESCDDNDQWSTIVEFDLPANALSEEQQSLNELRV
ncbi:hypothetical protein VTK73DRAFT_8071 [Phialemonium thermophilum]|uniref:Uncharacterized protein n=1 Tax=Phialemonium thermophilum TaxID=223376 RepID=A0ABR3XQ53_9PEZI